MGYYVGNGIYEYLNRCAGKNNFYWTSGNMWLLVYGDSQFDPKVISVVSGNSLNMNITEDENMAMKAAWAISEGTDIPVNFIRFHPNMPVERVIYWQPGMSETLEISSSQLLGYFIQYGLEVNEMSAHKSINDKSSSPYHDWQRTNMGDSVVVTDIDLIHMQNGVPIEILELKRSIVPLEKWEPYPEDYRNFILLSKLAQKRGLGFHIVYNRRTKKPFRDDISRLKIFEFDHRMQPFCRFLEYTTIRELAGEIDI